MVRKPIWIGGSLLIVGALGAWFFAVRTTDSSIIRGRVEGTSVEKNQPAANQAVTADSNLPDANTVVAPQTNDGELPAGSTNQVSQAAPSFSDYFHSAYMAKFTGKPRSPVQEKFQVNDNIVLVVQVKKGLQTKDRLGVQIYKGSALLKDQQGIEIVDGEIGLSSPGKKGSYTVSMVVNGQVLKELPFIID